MLPGNGERNWYFITIQKKDWKYQQQTWEWAGGNEKANGVTRSGQWSLFYSSILFKYSNTVIWKNWWHLWANGEREYHLSCSPCLSFVYLKNAKTIAPVLQVSADVVRIKGTRFSYFSHCWETFIANDGAYRDTKFPLLFSFWIRKGANN